MKHFIWNHFIVVTALAIGAGTATAQQASNPPTSPVQTISNAAFQQLVAAGQAAPVTPGTLLAQDLRQAIADLEHRAIIQTFLRNNPNLPRLAALFNLTPTD